MPAETTSASPRIGVIATLLCFVLLNVALLPLRHYFELQHRTNLMQADHATDGVTATPRYDWSTGGEQAKYWAHIPDARRTPLVILDGMSQQYAINDGQPGDKITAEILDDSLQAAGTRVFGIAAPNLNHEELLFHLHALVANPATTPRALVFGVCFDKMRNIDLRPTMAKDLGADSALAARWRHFADSVHAEMPDLSVAMSRALEDAHTQDVTRIDQRIEQRLVGDIADVAPVVGLRTDLRSFLYERTYLFRNWIFGIKTSTKRPVLADRYALNQQALVAAVRFARAHGIAVSLYVIPLNKSAEAPYVAEQYDSFKQWLALTAQHEGAHFANLEDAVPNESWGLLYGQPDFKHFKEAGHIVTANSLLPLVRSLLADSAAR